VVLLSELPPFNMEPAVKALISAVKTLAESSESKADILAALSSAEQAIGHIFLC